MIPDHVTVPVPKDTVHMPVTPAVSDRAAVFDALVRKWVS